jgi:hypothetical protein
MASVRTLEPHELGGGRGRGMNGTHRPDGILLATGEGADALELGGGPHLTDVAPTLLAALGWLGRSAGRRSSARHSHGSEEEALVGTPAPARLPR